MRRVLLAAILTVAAAPMATAQSSDYFGRNRVQYGRFDFKIVQTEHFEIYYYDRSREVITDMARMAERSYARLSQILTHRFEDRKPIIIYASHPDFQQTNLTYEEIGEETGGFTDFSRHRNTFPLTGSYDDDEHVLAHEMVHQFQFDIWARDGSTVGMQVAMQVPGWLAEGMAEYLSLGPYDTKTAMWLRDGAAEGKLPTAGDFYSEQFFPYQYGHSLMSYLGARWGDEAVGRLLKFMARGGMEQAVRQVTGLSFQEFVDQWRDAVTKQYLAEIGERVKAKTIATPILSHKDGRGFYVGPALSPDGSRIAYFSEGDIFSYTLWLADAKTGKPIRKLLKTSLSGDYESYRYLTSSSAWSPDGKMIALAAQYEGKDVIVLIDAEKGHEIQRISPKVSGITTPSFSPDGKQLVFSGLNGGMSDLYVVNIDGSGFRRLTSDRYADLHPVWSPDGTEIAFVTDRGPETNLDELQWGNLKIAVYQLASGNIEILPGMDEGRNSNPQWAPDGKTIAFVSDRDNVANIFLFDRADSKVYQLTNFYTGASGVTPLSPVLSWAGKSDEMAFVYFELQGFNIYKLSNPRSLKKDPYLAHSVAPEVLVRNQLTSFQVKTTSDSGTDSSKAAARSWYRGRNGFRHTDSLDANSPFAQLRPMSVARILDSTKYPLPDSTEFVYRNYKAKFEPLFIGTPTIGYTRSAYAQGVFAQSAIVLSDLLEDQQLLFAVSLNGRLVESEFLAQYTNLKRRLNWAASVYSTPYFWYGGSQLEPPDNSGLRTQVTTFQRVILRGAEFMGAYPFSRFSRIEPSLRFTTVDFDLLQIREQFNSNTGIGIGDADITTMNIETGVVASPGLAYVFDNTEGGFVGPIAGRRSRFEVAPNIAISGNTWRFTAATLDTRRYDRIVGNLVLSTRGLVFGRFGTDETRFRFYGGEPEFVRGFTWGSYLRNECGSATGSGNSQLTGCEPADELVGTRAAIFNAELRQPLFGPFLAPIRWRLPIFIESAVFYDAGAFWERGATLKLSNPGGSSTCDRDEQGNISGSCIRTPKQSVGASLRFNLFNAILLRLDYAIPFHRDRVGGLWTLNFGPVF